jgi:hypothetical protein
MESPMLTISSPMRVTRRLLGTAVAVLLATSAFTRADAQATTSSSPAGLPVVTAVPGVHGSKKMGAAARRAPLDLHTPPLEHLYPRSELRYILAADDSSNDSPTEVSVKSRSYTVHVPGAPGNQLQAIPWAIVHPTQAWRIFTPLVEE